MSERIPTEYQEILNQIHSNVFLDRLKDYLDDGTNLNENGSSDLINLARRLQVQDTTSSFDSEDIQKLLEDKEFRDYLLEAIHTFIKYQSKET